MGTLHRPAQRPPTREIPRVGKSAALRRLHRLQAAVNPVQPHTRAVRFLQQRQPGTMLVQLRVVPDKISFTEPQKRSNLRNFSLRQLHVPRPPTTGGAALTVEIGFHENMNRMAPPPTNLTEMSPRARNFRIKTCTPHRPQASCRRNSRYFSLPASDSLPTTQPIG